MFTNFYGHYMKRQYISFYFFNNGTERKADYVCNCLLRSGYGTRGFIILIAPVKSELLFDL